MDFEVLPANADYRDDWAMMTIRRIKIIDWQCVRSSLVGTGIHTSGSVLFIAVYGVIK